MLRQALNPLRVGGWVCGQREDGPCLYSISSYGDGYYHASYFRHLSLDSEPLPLPPSTHPGDTDRYVS